MGVGEYKHRGSSSYEEGSWASRSLCWVYVEMPLGVFVGADIIAGVCVGVSASAIASFSMIGDVNIVVSWGCGSGGKGKGASGGYIHDHVATAPRRSLSFDLQPHRCKEKPIDDQHSHIVDSSNKWYQRSLERVTPRLNQTRHV